MIGHADPEAMVKTLVQYIKCDKRVRREVLSEFHTAPTPYRIWELRRSHRNAAKKLPPVPFKPHEGYYPATASDALAAANDRFVAAMLRERGL